MTARPATNANNNNNNNHYLPSAGRGGADARDDDEDGGGDDDGGGGDDFSLPPFLLLPSHPSPHVKSVSGGFVLAAAELFTMAGDRGGRKENSS